MAGPGSGSRGRVWIQLWVHGSEPRLRPANYFSDLDTTRIRWVSKKRSKPFKKGLILDGSNRVLDPWSSLMWGGYSFRFMSRHLQKGAETLTLMFGAYHTSSNKPTYGMWIWLRTVNAMSHLYKVTTPKERKPKTKLTMLSIFKTITFFWQSKFHKNPQKKPKQYKMSLNLRVTTVLRLKEENKSR